MNHAGDNNAYDENDKYHEEHIYVPASPNVMTAGNAASGQSLQSFITSPINQQPANKGSNTISIKQMYIHRFGHNTPKATLAIYE